MHQLRVVYDEGQEEKVEGIIVDADVRKTVIKDDQNQLHTVNSDFVTLKEIETDDMDKYVQTQLSYIVEHYQEAEVTEVVRQEIEIVYEYLTKLLKESKENKLKHVSGGNEK